MSEPIIEIDRLDVRLGGHVILSGIQFQVVPGDFMAILGPNGSGKSTLLKAVLGLVEPSRGEVRVFGRSPREVPPGWIGYVPQIKTLDRRFPAQAIELVLTALRQRWVGRISASGHEQGREALRAVGAEHLAHRPVGELSGGELQRVYLARSLIRRPRLIILDEPATGIDVAGASDLYAVLDAYQREAAATVVMVTHDWDVAFHHATRALLLNGTQVSVGPPREALRDAYLREAFGHVGHAHAMLMGGTPDA